MKSSWNGSAGKSGWPLRGKNWTRLTPKRAPRSKSMAMPRMTATFLRSKAVAPSPSIIVSSCDSMPASRTVGEVTEPPRPSMPRARLVPSTTFCGKIQPARPPGSKSITPPGVLPLSTALAPVGKIACIWPPPSCQDDPLAPPMAMLRVSAVPCSAANNSSAIGNQYIATSLNTPRERGGAARCAPRASRRWAPLLPLTDTFRGRPARRIDPRTTSAGRTRR